MEFHSVTTSFWNSTGQTPGEGATGSYSGEISEGKDATEGTTVFDVVASTTLPLTLSHIYAEIGAFTLTRELVAFMETPTPVVLGVILLVVGFLGFVLNTYLLIITRTRGVAKNPVIILIKVSHQGDGGGGGGGTGAKKGREEDGRGKDIVKNLVIIFIKVNQEGGGGWR